MDDALQATIRNCPQLPSVPTIAVEVLELARDPSTDMKKLAKVIERDPALSGRVLKTVNSSFYGRNQKVTTIEQSLVVMGLQSVKTLVLGFSLVDGLMKSETAGFDHGRYWKRSFYAACAAKELGVRARVMQAEELFICGLLGDIGMLVLDACMREVFGEACALAQSHGEQHLAERKLLETDHAEVGGFMAEMWKLPPVLSEPIQWHVEPDRAEEGTLRQMARILAAAGRCADVFVDESPAQAIADVRRHVKELVADADEGAADELLEVLGKSVQEAGKAFEFDVGPETRFDAILREANEALIELSLQSQQAAVDLQQKAADMEARFAEREAELKKQATVDGMTGLANRKEFDRFLSEELAESIGMNRPLSLIMIDIDKFKSVNDTHGHQAGDKVIVHMATLLAKHAGEGDLAARYGGEEMAIVLLHTDRATAAAVAEDIRRKLAAAPIDCGDVQLPITASFGVAAFEPGSPLVRPELVLKAADRALYHAKESGRNRVKVFSLPRAAPAATTNKAA